MWKGKGSSLRGTWKDPVNEMGQSTLAAQVQSSSQSVPGTQASCQQEIKDRTKVTLEGTTGSVSTFNLTPWFWGSQEGCQGPFRPSGRNRGLPLRSRGGQGPHLAKRWEPRGFSRVAGGFSSYDGDLSIPLGLALGSPIFPSGQGGELPLFVSCLKLSTLFLSLTPS